MKYYLTKDTSRPVFVEGRKYLFDPCHFVAASNTWWGTLATEEEAEIADLDRAVPTGACSVIDKAEWDVYQAKKKLPRPASNLIDFGLSHSPQALSAPSGRPVEVVENPAPARAASFPKPEAETLAEVLTPRKGRR